MSDALAQADLDALNKDIEDAKKSLVATELDKATAKVKAEVRQELEKELQLKQELEAAKREQEELKKQLEATRNEAAQKIATIQSKVDQVVASKGIVGTPGTNPFDTKKGPEVVDTWSHDKINRIEEESARQFFGPDYEIMLRANR